MKTNSKKITTFVIGVVCALTGVNAYAGTMGEIPCASKRVYAGVFGGAGASNKVNVSQLGTAYFTEALGGPLAVDAFGKTNSRTVGLVGGHVGYQWAEVLNPLSLSWGLAPAAELEGYYLSSSKFTSHDINNNTPRLEEHDFLVTYPMQTGVFLANAVLNFNMPQYDGLHPYVGVGIGAAITSIRNASSIQVAPAEVGVNHYNSHVNANAATFASQVKAGLDYSFYNNLSVFAEYRWLYLANTSYTFGSTVFPGHAATSSWMVNFGSQYYNMGDVGIRYSV